MKDLNLRAAEGVQTDKNSGPLPERRGDCMTDQIKMREINEAIRDLDGRLTQLEGALRMENDSRK